QPLRRAEEEVAGEPVHLDGLAKFPQMRRRLGRAVDVAREQRACRMSTYHPEASVSKRESNACEDDSDEHADDEAIFDANEHDEDRQQQILPGALHVEPGERIDEERVAEVEDEPGDDRHGNEFDEVEMRYRDDAENQCRSNPAHACRAACLLEQHAGTGLQCAGDPAEWRCDEIRDAMRTKFAIEIPGRLANDLDARDLG